MQYSSMREPRNGRSFSTFIPCVDLAPTTAFLLPATTYTQERISLSAKVNPEDIDSSDFVWNDEGINLELGIALQE
jgi:hypothetical protein